MTTMGLALCGWLGAAELVKDFSLHSLVELQKLRDDIEEEMKGVARASLNSGVGPIGYRSKWVDEPDHPEWVQIDLGGEGPVDEIVMVPALWRDTERGFVSDAFPAAFRIIVGTHDEDEGKVVFEIKDTSEWLPRVAPVVLPLEGVRASWIRVEATRLNPRAFDGHYLFQLSELMVMEGETNRALRRQVTPLRDPSDPKLKTWNNECLVDGILPYVMNAAEGSQSLPVVGLVEEDEVPMITIDLEGEQLLSGIRLHAVDQSDTAPQAFGGDFGLPRHFRLEGASNKDFSDARELLDVQLSSIFQTGPVMAWNFDEVMCRHVRLVAIEPNLAESPVTGLVRMGFAEIELIAEGDNVALGRPVVCNFIQDSPDRSETALTDGLNLYGEILPPRRWMVELARRHDLEVALPRVTAELSSRYDRQRDRLNLVSWVAVSLGAGIGLLLLYFRMRSMRQEKRIRERIAANLHDELGANLHAIGLLGDLAKDAIKTPEELVDTLDRIRGLTERTGSAARNCANMIGAKDVCEDLTAEMRRDSSRLLADLDYTLEFEGEEILRRMKRRRRIDLYLFYKEALVNVIRHSGATRVESRLVADSKRICLTVTDNGHGYSGSPPASLARRARMLGARFNLDSPDSGGTLVRLTLKTRSFRSPR
ncbi:histidine kinase [Haloferula sp.]|uniref:histidine kinase n=1 Tax=Haloferula sp. TaxID=2497595 RepID=UPI003C70B29F